MAKQFYYQNGNTTVGPCDSQKLRAAVAHGEVQPETLILLGESGQKVPAHKLRGLFENDHVASAAASGSTGNSPRGQAAEIQSLQDPPLIGPPSLPPDLGRSNTIPDIPPNSLETNASLPSVPTAAQSHFEPRDYSLVETYVCVLKAVGFILLALAAISCFSGLVVMGLVVMNEDIVMNEDNFQAGLTILFAAVAVGFSSLLTFVIAQLMTGLIDLFRDNHRQLHFVELISDRILSDVNE